MKATVIIFLVIVTFVFLLWMNRKTEKYSADGPIGPLDKIGTIPVISSHYSASPQHYDFENSPVEQLNDLITRQYLMGSQSMIVKFNIKKGGIVPLHYHSQEQVTWITKGSVKVTSQGKEYIVNAGDVIIFAPYIPHQFEALEDTIDIDFFSPVRGDWLDGSANYFKN